VPGMMLRMSMQSAEQAREPSERRTFTLPVSMARRLDFQAQAKRRSVSSILREALDAYLEGQPPPKLPSFVGIGRSGEHDVSERVEEIIAEMIDKGEIP